MKHGAAGKVAGWRMPPASLFETGAYGRPEARADAAFAASNPVTHAYFM
jgi:hypothetical protein